ncbi:MAG: protein-disulfide reductase DsbD [Gammaproteobacteria bacterium]
MRLWKILSAALLLLALPAHALDAIDAMEPELLDPDRAFEFTVTVRDATTLQASWKIADGYYMYRDRIRFRSDTPGIEAGTPVLPAGKIKNDEFFGEIAVFRNRVTATIPLSRTPDAPNTLQLNAVSQGCADIGVCYPPHTQQARLDLPATAAAAAATTSNNTLQSLNTLTSKLGLDSGADEFLDPDEAFQASVTEIQPGLLLVRWDIADGYYLYRDKLKVQLADSPGVTLGPVVLPPGETKHDEFFGDVQVFHHEVEARIPVQVATVDSGEITLQLAYQGCAEAGICYPPIKKLVSVDITAPIAATVSADSATPAEKRPAVAVNTTRQDDVVRVLQESGLLWVVLFFFGAGILLAFTACMYPMIPIISSIIVGQGEQITTFRAFILTLLYVEALAVTYAVIGVISAHAGAGVQAFFQNPWILGLFALVFVALAISMFGFFHLQLPASWQSKLHSTSHKMKGGTLLGVVVMGVLSALIVGPCAGPVLIGALIYTSQSSDYLTGALAMFALGNGMGLPLLVIATTEGKLLPKAGGWMDTVKAVFGVVLLGVAILMLERILPGPVTLALWALLLIIPAVYMGALDTLPEGVSGWRKLWKGLGVAMIVYGIILILGAATGARDPFNPLRNLGGSLTTAVDGTHTSGHLQFERIKSVDDFNTALRSSSTEGKPVMLDFYADWCTYCIKMEDYTFSDQAVQQALVNVTLLQADVTANDATDLALLNHFGLFAPPAILFFDKSGQERRDQRMVGYMDAEDFLEYLEGAIGG